MNIRRAERRRIVIKEGGVASAWTGLLKWTSVQGSQGIPWAFPGPARLGLGFCRRASDRPNRHTTSRRPCWLSAHPLPPTRQNTSALPPVSLPAALFCTYFSNRRGGTTPLCWPAILLFSWSAPVRFHDSSAARRLFRASRSFTWTNTTNTTTTTTTTPATTTTLDDSQRIYYIIYSIIPAESLFVPGLT